MEEKRKKVLSLVLLGLFVGSFLIMSVGLVSAEDSGNTFNFYLEEKSVEQGTWYAGIFNFLGMGETWQQVILALIIIAIIFAGMYDMLTLISLFDTMWVRFVIAGGLGIAAGLIGLVRVIATMMFSFAAGLGAFGIMLEIILVIVIFIGLSFGRSWAANFAAKRRAAKAKAAGIKIGGAIRAIGEIEKALEKVP